MIGGYHSITLCIAIREFNRSDSLMLLDGKKMPAAIREFHCSDSLTPLDEKEMLVVPVAQWRSGNQRIIRRC
ncbi:unnamed protein product [Toxocara canis]|uniref:Transposase n=1 Tax=Toxocara canis TaxID=6265 RepID=A0A183U5B2_TOXCA|nr:unnamed protein product [Toxocara canis]